MRLLLVLGMLALCSLDAAAQGWLIGRRKLPVSADATPNVTITAPTAESIFQTSATTLDIAGIASDDRSVAKVEWVNNRGGSGTANGRTVWDVTASLGTATIGQDSFNVAADTALPSLTPVVGSAWVERVDTNSNDTCQAYASSGSFGPSATRLEEILMCSLTPSAPLGGTNYTVQGTRADVANVASGVEAGLFFGYNTGNGNFCHAVWLGGTLKLRLYSFVGGVSTLLGSSSTAVPIGGVVKVDVNGTAVKVYVDDVQMISVTSAACGVTGQAGGYFGPASLIPNHTQHVSSRINNFEIVDRGGTTASVPLLSGTNIITVTVTDSAGQTATDVLTVVQGVSDTVPPVGQIEVPTTAATWVSSVAALTVSGTSSDNIAPTAPTWACPQCSVTSGTATGTSAWTFSVTQACSAGGTANVITVTFHDAVGLTSSKVLTSTCDSADVVDPAIAITLPTSSATYDAGSATTIILQGTASDTGGSGLSQILWISDRGGSGSATTSPSWTTPSIALASGVNVITVTALDGAGNDATDTITVTSTPPCAITTTSMPAAIVGTAYSFQLSANAGCVLPLVWSNNGGGTTLRDADAQCAGLSVNNAGLVTASNPTTNGDCTWTASLTDNAAATDTQPLTIVVQASSSGADAYWTALQARGDLWKSWDLRSQATIDAFSQLEGQETTNPFVTYDFSGDLDPHKMNAAKIVIPPFYTVNSHIATTMTAAADYWGCSQPAWPGLSCVVRVPFEGKAFVQKTDRWMLIDNEIVHLVDPDGGGATGPVLPWTQATQEVIFQRGVNGTTIASHTAGAAIRPWNNDLLRQVRFPLNTEDSFTYFFTWDYKNTDSYVGDFGPFDQHKTWQFECRIDNRGSGKICLEPNHFFGANLGTFCGTASGNIVGTDVAAFKLRTYHKLNGNADWDLSTGDQLGPGVTKGNPLCPMAGQFVIKSNIRTRYFARIVQRAHGYDDLTMWIADETTAAAVKVFDSIPASLDLNNGNERIGISNFWIELDSSYEGVSPNRYDLHSYVSYQPWFAVLRAANSGTSIAPSLNDAALASAGLLAPPR